jgi:hypothetical protein
MVVPGVMPAPCDPDRDRPRPNRHRGLRRPRRPFPRHLLRFCLSADDPDRGEFVYPPLESIPGTRFGDPVWRVLLREIAEKGGGKW